MSIQSYNGVAQAYVLEVLDYEKLDIEWRHFEKDGETCERCAGTGTNLAEVIASIFL